MNFKILSYLIGLVAIVSTSPAFAVTSTSLVGTYTQAKYASDAELSYCSKNIQIVVSRTNPANGEIRALNILNQQNQVIASFDLDLAGERDGEFDITETTVKIGDKSAASIERVYPAYPFKMRLLRYLSKSGMTMELQGQQLIIVPYGSVDSNEYTPLICLYDRNI